MGAGNQSGGSNGGAGGSRKLSCDANHRVLLLNPATVEGVFWGVKNFCVLVLSSGSGHSLEKSGFKIKQNKNKFIHVHVPKRKFTN